MACLFLAGGTAGGQAVFSIDSIPPKGVLLDKAWKWQLGDQPHWAKPQLDDTHWDTLNPVLTIDQLKQLPKQAIGWLRIPLTIAPALRGKRVGLAIQQMGASELFLNGQFVLGIGEINAQKRVAIGCLFQYSSSFVLGADSLQVMAIRYSFTNDQVLNRLPYVFCSVKLMPYQEAEKAETQQDLFAVVEFSLMGAFLVLGLLQLLIYFVSGQQRTAFSLGLFLVSQGIVHFLNGVITPYAFFQFFNIANITLVSDALFIAFVTGIAVSSFFYLLGIYQYFAQRKQPLFWLTASLTLATIPAALSLYGSYGHLAYFILGVIIPFSEILRIGLVAIKQKRFGANLFTLTHGFTLLVFLGWTLNTFSPWSVIFGQPMAFIYLASAF